MLIYELWRFTDSNGGLGGGGIVNRRKDASKVVTKVSTNLRNKNI